MKIACTLLLALSVTTTIYAQTPVVQFGVSKPLCVFTFIETALQRNGTSQTYHRYIKTHIPPEDSAAFRKLIAAYASINFPREAADPKLPQKRQKSRTAESNITVAAARSLTIAEMAKKPIPYVSDTQQAQLISLLQQAEPIYDKIVWNDHGASIYKHLEELKPLTPQLGYVFNHISHFYGSTWPADKPFNVYIYPIPARGGHSSATPYGDILVQNLFIQESNYPKRLAVTVHEIGHVLYETQPMSLQYTIDEAFNKSKSPYAQFAYNYIDEALATACGNAWAYKTITGTADSNSWYDDKTIDGFAHAIYPLVEQYINRGKTIDTAFINAAIAAYQSQFPDAIYNYENLIMYNHLYTDIDSHTQFRDINNELTKRFSMAGSFGGYPLLDQRNIASIKTSPGTQLFIIPARNKENISGLQKIFPQLKHADPAKEMLISFIDNNQRAIIIINVHSMARVADALELMKKQERIGKDIYTYLD